MKNKLIAKIHVIKKQLGLDDDGYRMALMNVVGKNSCKAMNIRELTLVIERLSGRRDGRGEYIATDCRKLKKIIKMWAELGQDGKVKDGSNKGLQKFIAARFNEKLEKLKQSNYGQGVKDKIIEALKEWKCR